MDATKRSTNTRAADDAMKRCSQLSREIREGRAEIDELTRQRSYLAERKDTIEKQTAKGSERISADLVAGLDQVDVAIANRTRSVNQAAAALTQQRAIVERGF